MYRNEFSSFGGGGGGGGEGGHKQQNLSLYWYHA